MPNSRILILHIVVTKLPGQNCSPVLLTTVHKCKTIPMLVPWDKRNTYIQNISSTFLNSLLTHCQVLKTPWQVEVLINSRHKQKSLDLSLKQSLHRDMTFALDLICKVFYKHITQFVNLRMVHKTYFIIVGSPPFIFFSYKKYWMIQTQIHQRSCYEMKQDTSSPPWCVQESRGSRWKNLPSTPYLKKGACSGWPLE